MLDSGEGLLGMAQMGVLKIHPRSARNVSLDQLDCTILSARLPRSAGDDDAALKGTEGGRQPRFRLLDLSRGSARLRGYPWKAMASARQRLTPKALDTRRCDFAARTRPHRLGHCDKGP